MARTKNLSGQEKYERQKALAKERQRRKRAKLTDEELEKKRKADRDRYNRLKQENKIKSIKEKTPREQRKMRKYWRLHNKKRQEKKKALNEVMATPPNSPLSVESSVQKRRGQKIKRRDKAKAYRTIKKQSDVIKNLERKLEKYKKRLTREKNKLKLNSSPSPRKQVADLVGSNVANVSPKVKRQLLLGFALQKQLELQAKEAGPKKKDKQVLRKVMGNKILKKYRVQKYFTKVIPYRCNKVLKENTNKLDYTVKPKLLIRHQLSSTLRNFYEDDTVSRMCPGKKDYVKKGIIKKQRRILLDTLENLHKRFLKESKAKISLSSFSRSKPFWVTHPKKSDRDTCACVKHSNMEFLVSALKKMGIIQERNLNEVVAAVVCSIKTEACMMSICEICDKKEIQFSFNENFKMKYFQWRNVAEERTIKNVKKMIKKTVKVRVIKEVSEVIQCFKEEMVNFKKHLFNAIHQSSELKKKVDGLKKGEILFRIDFSENYVAKYSEEVQSIHFGASKRQITLNTGVLYALQDGKVQTECFCTASDNLDHQAYAVWAHLEPILKWSAKRFPETTTIHFFSDSPSSQYRNKFNMYLFKIIVPRFFLKAKFMTWNFTEAGHGKGPMDGVGGALKRGADRKVSHGLDITSASDFVSAMKDSTILLLEVKPALVLKYKRELALTKIPAITGIMKVHQVTYSCGIMNAQRLSCFECPPSQYCDHYTHACDIFPDDEEDLDDDIITNPYQKQTSKRLHVDDIFSSSDDEELVLPGPSCSVLEEAPQTSSSHADIIDEEPPEKRCKKQTPQNVDVGVFVLVKFENSSKKSKRHQFVAVCQSEVLNNEFEAMFMNNCSKDNALFYPNERDTSIVNMNQVVSVLPNPVITLKGNRIFYKFKTPIKLF